MAELAIPYALTGPDGTRAVVGNSDVARLDPDWIGYLDADNPPSIVRSIRGSDDPRTEGDGAVPGNRFHSGASIVMRGVLDPNAGSSTINAYEQKLKRATRAMRADGVLRFAPSGYPERAFWFRRASDIDISGRRPKTWQLALDAANPYGLSPDEDSAPIIPGSAAGEIGFGSPFGSPFSSAIGVTGQTVVTNIGDVETWPSFRVMGPISNPRIVNNSTGREVRLTYTLLAGEYLDIYPVLGRILLGGASDRYSAYDRANSRWWQLRAGPNDIRLLATAYGAGAQLTVYWRNAWE